MNAVKIPDSERHLPGNDVGGHPIGTTRRGRLTRLAT